MQRLTKSCIILENSTMAMDEKLLISGCVNGDRKAQKALYEKYSRSMMAVCFRYVNDTEDARDLLQEGFIKVFANISKYKGEGSFDGWVRRIFTNCALEHLRHADALRNASDITEFDYPDVEDEALDERIPPETVMECVRALPDGFRTVFNLYAIEDFSHKEIAQQLGITESTSRTQYMRARKMLQNMIVKRLNEL